jgi:hypothetical protein
MQILSKMALRNKESCHEVILGESGRLTKEVSGLDDDATRSNKNKANRNIGSHCQQRKKRRPIITLAEHE